jgi:hypothetical protein
LADSIIEAPIGLTLKCSDDRDAPCIKLRASNVQQLQSQLLEIESSGVLVDIGRVAALFQIKARLGAQLGATPLDPDKDGGSFDNVQAAPAVSAAVTPPPAAPAKKAGSFPAFKAKPAAATPPPAATPPAATRPATEPPPAAPATGGFPAAPAWKKP